MLHPYISFPDDTEIVCSDIFHKPGSKKDYIDVYFERPSKDGQSFDSMHCVLPSTNSGMQDVVGFSDAEANYHYDVMKKLAADMIDYVKEESQNA